MKRVGQSLRHFAAIRRVSAWKRGRHTRRMAADATENEADTWQVYLLRCADGTLYTGITTDLARRLAEHNAGRGARYTRSRLPAELVYVEPAPDRSAAQRREYAIRRMPAAAKRRLLTTRGD